MSKSKRILPLIIIAAGAIAAAALVATRPETGVSSDVQRPRLVRTVRATATSHRIAVSTFGTSRADKEWTATAEVSGRITFLAENFDDGEVLQEGTRLATIDTLDYELALKTAQTDIQAQEQKLLEIAQSKENIQSILDLREQQVSFAKAELDRLQDLVERNAGSRSEFERAATSYLDGQTALQDLKNELALIPIRTRLTETALEAATLRVSQAQRNIDRCEIKVPFTGFCLDRSVDLHQHVPVGMRLGNFLSVDKGQVIALVEARRALTLFPNLGKSIGTIDLRAQSTSVVKELRRYFEILNVPVDITWRAGEGIAQWRGRLARVSATVDEKTRAVPLIIEVDDAFTAIELGVRPALVPGMFLEIVIYGELAENVFVLPRDAVRDDHVYLVREGKLVIQPVHVKSLEDELAVIDSGLVDGDQVVLADLFPAANGMLLRSEVVDNPVRPRLELPELP